MINKKAHLFLFMLIMAITLVGCNNTVKKTKEPNSNEMTDSASIISEIMEAVEFPEMIEVNNDNFSTFYDIDSDAYLNYKAYVSASPSKVDEIAVFEKSESGDGIVDGLISRWQSQIDSFKDFDETEYLRVRDDGFVKVNGRFVIYLVCSDAGTAEDIFDKYEPDIPVNLG
jgi:hypothetical protein